MDGARCLRFSKPLFCFGSVAAAAILRNLFVKTFLVLEGQGYCFVLLRSALDKDQHRLFVHESIIDCVVLLEPLLFCV